MRQTALHWAAVRGSVAVAGVLLESGAWVEAADIKWDNLDKPCQFLASISGYIRRDYSVIQSLMFRSNIRRHGHFGKEKGSSA